MSIHFVVRVNGQPVEKALKKLKKKFRESSLARGIKQHITAVRPSQKRRQKDAQAARRRRACVAGSAALDAARRFRRECRSRAPGGKGLGGEQWDLLPDSAPSLPPPSHHLRVYLWLAQVRDPGIDLGWRRPEGGGIECQLLGHVPAGGGVDDVRPVAPEVAPERPTVGGLLREADRPCDMAAVRRDGS